LFVGLGLEWASLDGLQHSITRTGPAVAAARCGNDWMRASYGALLIGPARDFCDAWPRQQKVTVPGIHYLQEDSPTEIGVAIARFIKALPE